MNEKEKTFLEKSKEALNEISSENTLFDVIQIGPQEEPIIHDFKINVEQYRRYLQKQKEKKQNFE